jgi:hypothetical protein
MLEIVQRTSTCNREGNIAHMHVGRNKHIVRSNFSAAVSPSEDPQSHQISAYTKERRFAL